MRAAIALLLSLLLAAPPVRAQERLTIIRDAETETLLRNFSNPLFRAAGIAPGLVRIVILREDALNAFVSTGNRLFVNTGLITACQSAAELVGVLAHETGHIRGGHLARLPEAMRNALIQSIAAVLIGAAAGVAARDGGAAAGGILGGTNMAQRNLLAFTRGMETSADQGALTILDRLGWSAQGMLDLFTRLSEQEALLSDMQDPYLITHPLTQDRMATLRAHLAGSPNRLARLPAGFDGGFAMMRAKLQAFLAPSSVTLRRVRETDSAAPARYARAVALYRLGHTDEALALIDGLIAEQPGNPWLLELKGQVLFEGGRGRLALAPYREAARLAPDQPLIRGALGRAMIETNDPLLLKPAIAELEYALARENDDPTNWRALATAWGRAGNIAQADLALAEEQLLVGSDIRQARQLASRAAAALPPGPARLRALDISNAVKKENRSGF
jgi:predicted Zn-dependent protease